MKTLQDFLILAKKKVRQAKSLDYFLETDFVQGLIKKATDEEKEQLYAHLERSERELFTVLLDKIRSNDPTTMTVAALRNLARSLGVYGYHNLCRERLLVLIGEVRARKILENERCVGETTDKGIAAT
jgi:succinate dehydrogenase flavin-adding protein (antitoxin of CptAB toxin-antitoxin module)